MEKKRMPKKNWIKQNVFLLLCLNFLGLVWYLGLADSVCLKKLLGLVESVGLVLLIGEELRSLFSLD